MRKKFHDSIALAYTRPKVAHKEMDVELANEIADQLFEDFGWRPIESIPKTLCQVWLKLDNGKYSTANCTVESFTFDSDEGVSATHWAPILV